MGFSEATWAASIAMRRDTLHDTRERGAGSRR
jgi:hypothetical protein